MDERLDPIAREPSAAPGTPLAPSDLAADNVSPSFISLSWRNNSTNETSVQLWKSEDNVNFTLLTSLSARANSYTDNAVTAFSQYYYYVIPLNVFNADFFYLNVLKNIALIACTYHQPLTLHHAAV